MSEKYEEEYGPVETEGGRNLAKLFYEQDQRQALSNKMIRKKIVKKNLQPKKVPSINSFFGVKRSGFKKRQSSLVNLARIQKGLSKFGRR